MSAKIPIAIYKIKDTIEYEEIIEQIQLNDYTQQELITDFTNYELTLLYKKYTPNIKWKDFFSEFVNLAAEILNRNISVTENYILIIKNSNSDNIYAISGGTGFFEFVESIDTEFGISVISRIINKEQKILKATKETILIGSVYGETKYFRSSSNLFENENFGAFYQEVKTMLDQSILKDKLGFSDEDIKKDSMCIAKSSFKITRSIEIEELLKIIDGCEEILSTLNPIELNQVQKISRSSNKALIKELKSFLVYQLWKSYKKVPGSFKFDLCHNDFEKYLTAERHELSIRTYNTPFLQRDNYDSILEVEDIFHGLEAEGKHYNTIKNFSHMLTSLKIQTYDENGKILTKAPFKSHLFADISFRGSRYFFTNNDFYLIKDDFLNELNTSCNTFINEKYHNSLSLETWGESGDFENHYNQKYFDIENSYVVDKITPENIELSDVIRWDENTLYLYHVKIGFGNTMRDLCSQILISARRIQQSSSADYDFIKEEYRLICSKVGGEEYFDKVGHQVDNISEEDFTDLFRSRKIKFVLLIKDSAQSVRSIKDVKDFNSNIAKFSINELFKDMNRLGIELEIAEILD